MAVIRLLGAIKLKDIRAFPILDFIAKAHSECILIDLQLKDHADKSIGQVIKNIDYSQTYQFDRHLEQLIPNIKSHADLASTAVTLLTSVREDRPLSSAYFLWAPGRLKNEFCLDYPHFLVS